MSAPALAVAEFRYTPFELYRLRARETARRVFRPKLLGLVTTLVCIALTLSIVHGQWSPGTFLGGIMIAMPVWFVMSVISVVFLPAVSLITLRNHPGVKEGHRIEFSEAGIATIMGPTSNFGGWSYIVSATEDRNYLIVRFRLGVIHLPKQRLPESDLVAIRSIIRSHLGDKAKI